MQKSSDVKPRRTARVAALSPSEVRGQNPFPVRLVEDDSMPGIAVRGDAYQIREFENHPPVEDGRLRLVDIRGREKPLLRHVRRAFRDGRWGVDLITTNDFPEFVPRKDFLFCSVLDCVYWAGRNLTWERSRRLLWGPRQVPASEEIHNSGSLEFPLLDAVPGERMGRLIREYDMAPLLHPGDSVVCRGEQGFEDGDLCLVRLKNPGGEPPGELVRHVHRQEGGYGLYAGHSPRGHYFELAEVLSVHRVEVARIRARWLDLDCSLVGDVCSALRQGPAWNLGPVTA